MLVRSKVRRGIFAPDAHGGGDAHGAATPDRIRRALSAISYPLQPSGDPTSQVKGSPDCFSRSTLPLVALYAHTWTRLAALAWRIAGSTNAVSGSKAGTTQFTLGSATEVPATTASLVLQSAMTTSLTVTLQASGQYFRNSACNP